MTATGGAGGTIVLRINGEDVEVEASAGDTLLTVLRERLGLTGSKLACGVGECGACTVLVDGRPVLSCIMLAGMVRGAVETVEGLTEESEALRQAFADAGAFQCGYCTPGQVVRGVSILRDGAPADDAGLRHALSGNICRCTGYVPIVNALRSCTPAEET